MERVGPRKTWSAGIHRVQAADDAPRAYGVADVPLPPGPQFRLTGSWPLACRVKGTLVNICHGPKIKGPLEMPELGTPVVAGDLTLPCASFQSASVKSGSESPRRLFQPTTA